MNRQDDSLADLYERLNRGHDLMRESLLARLPSTVDGDTSQLEATQLRIPDDRPPVTRKRESWHRWYAVSALGSAATVLLATGMWIALTWAPSLTLAQVKSAVVQQKWVLTKYTDGEERWISLLNGRRFIKLPSGRVGLFAPEISQRYLPPNPDGAFPSGHIIESRATPEQMKEIPPWKPISAWEYLVSKAEEAARETGSDSKSLHKSERHEEVVDGRKLVRFDSVYVDALGNKKIRSQVWADPVTRLPVRVRKAKDSRGVDPSDDNSYTDGAISFPDEGPTDIYSLGAPRDAKIVRVHSDGRDPEVVNRPADLQRLIADARESIGNFPGQFRLVKWYAEAIGRNANEVALLFWNGKPTLTGDPGTRFYDWIGVKIRQEQYFNLSDEHPLYHLHLPADAAQVLEWAKGQTPVDISIADGERTYSQSGPLPRSFEYRKPTLRVSRMRRNGILFDHNAWPMSMYWPFIPTIGSRMAGHHELVDEPSKPIPGTVLLRITLGVRRFDYYIASDRDHICLKHTWWRQRTGEWHKDREYELSDLRQLASKQWWAAKVRLQIFDDPDRGTSGYVITYLIDIALVEEGEFPAAAFDGQKLLEDAQKLNAEITAH